MNIQALADLQKTLTRTIARAMTLRRHDLAREEALMVAAIEAKVPELATAAVLLDRFQRMVRKRTADPLPEWLEAAAASTLASFARGLMADEPPNHVRSCDLVESRVPAPVPRHQRQCRRGNLHPHQRPP